MFCEQLGVYKRETKRSKEETDGGRGKANTTDTTRARNMPPRRAKRKGKKNFYSKCLMENRLEL